MDPNENDEMELDGGDSDYDDFNNKPSSTDNFDNNFDQEDACYSPTPRGNGGARRNSSHHEVENGDVFTFAQSPPHSIAAMQLAACCRCHKEFMVAGPGGGMVGNGRRGGNGVNGRNGRGGGTASGRDGRDHTFHSTFDSEENVCFECRDMGDRAAGDRAAGREDMMAAEIMISRSPPRRSRRGLLFWIFYFVFFCGETPFSSWEVENNHYSIMCRKARRSTKYLYFSPDGGSGPSSREDLGSTGGSGGRDGKDFLHRVFFFISLN